MAKASLYMARLRGKWGDMVFAKTSTGTVVKVTPEKKDVPTFTENQAKVSMRMTNIAHLWKLFGGNTRPSFQSVGNTKGEQYRAFLSANLSKNPMYFTKEQARAGACVVDAYTVSDGTLKAISTELDATTHKAKTNIALGTGFTIDDDTTVAEFSETIITNNGDRFKDGDQLTVFYAEQYLLQGVPRVAIYSSKIVLNSAASTTVLWDVVDAAHFAAVSGYLGGTQVITGGVAYIASRNDDSGSTLVSPQDFICNNATEIAKYSTALAAYNAAKSYGTLKEIGYVTPTAIDQPAN